MSRIVDMSITSCHTQRALRQTASACLADGMPTMLVSVAEIKGSTPRETGTRMLVSASHVHGTIGGGHLEWQAIDLARHVLAEQLPDRRTSSWLKTYPLGPTLGQCCGGVVTLRFAPLNDAEMALWPMPQPMMHIELHGAGHVGQAIVKLLADLDCTVRWIDTRDADEGAPGLPDAQLLAALPDHITWLPTDSPPDEVLDAPPGACHLVLTHRHDLDLRIIEAVLKRGDAAFAGLIGSQTKRAKFLHRLADKGLRHEQLAAMVCPIGLPGLMGKEPAVIAISVVAQLLQRHDRQSTA
ncbi:MAG: xanthine dehydrogenase accessory protein XdhC [Aquabacterium sp.]